MITSGPEIIQMTTGLCIDFVQHVYQSSPSLQLNFSPEEELAADAEIRKLLEKKAIVVSEHEEGEFISNVFLHPKKTGGSRLILNLKKLNKFVKYNKFKMETLLNILEMIEEGCYQTSVNFESTYLVVLIHSDYQKFLKFYWERCFVQICDHTFWSFNSP